MIDVAAEPGFQSFTEHPVRKAHLKCNANVQSSGKSPPYKGWETNQDLCCGPGCVSPSSETATTNVSSSTGVPR